MPAHLHQAVRILSDVADGIDDEPTRLVRHELGPIRLGRCGEWRRDDAEVLGAAGVARGLRLPRVGRELLRAVARLLADRAFDVANVDSTIIAQAPIATSAVAPPARLDDSTLVVPSPDGALLAIAVPGGAAIGAKVVTGMGTRSPKRACAGTPSDVRSWGLASVRVDASFLRSR